MLPLKLTVENFMPYRGAQEPLILEGLGIACLSGPNGAGKSSLLDAITWALWGRARGVDGRGVGREQLVAAGKSEMGVQLEFRAHGNVYRVERRIRIGRRPVPTFHFQIRDGSRWRSLDGTNTGETEDKLVETIHLDYNTFINSAFLVQGKADLFVSQPASERKRILGEILNLSVYDGYAQTAREMARDDRNRQEVARRGVEQIEAELQQESDIRAELEQAGERLSRLQESLQGARAEHDRLSTDLAEMQSRKRDLEEFERRIAALSNEVDDLTSRKQDAEQAVREDEGLLERQAEIEEGWNALRETRADLSDLGERSRKHGEFAEKASQLETAAAQMRGRLENDVAAAEQRHGDIAAEAGRLPEVQRQLHEANTVRADLAEQERELAERRVARDEMNGRLGEMRATLAALNSESNELDPRIVLIEADSDATCPVCGTELGQHGMERVREHFQQRKTEIAVQVQGLTDSGKALRGAYDALVKEIERADAAWRDESARASGQIGALETQAAQTQKAADGLAGAEIELEKARAALAAMPDESAELGEIRRKIAEIGYDSDAHAAAQERERELAHWDEERRSLDSASARLGSARATLADVTERWSGSTQRLAVEQTQAAGLEKGLSGMDELTEQAEAARITRELITSDISVAEQEKARLDERLTRLDARRGERDRLRTEEREAASRASVHDDLAQAFGPRGVQALLIETALPELEDDANDLLGRMTNGSMTLRLETQRQTQAGNTIETLEVIISDIQGTRAYEMYSGGEAFRINFALRIALSKLLARRAGSEVPVLFIDEGFGSQDAEGRERLIEAISELWNDPVFHNGLILIITHIDDVRNQFDTRIDVIKTENGSRYSLSA